MMEIEPHLRPYYLIAGVLVISGILFLAAGGSNRHGPYIDELMSENSTPYRYTSITVREIIHQFIRTNRI